MLLVFRKALCIYTAMLVALMPLQLAMAGNTGASETQHSGFQELIAPSDVKASRAELRPTQPCEECQIDESCISYNCTSGQCGNCMTLLPSLSRIYSIPVTGQNLNPFREESARLLPDLLFRPPQI